MKPFGYIGVDFGTSNSHFAYCNTAGDLKSQTIRLGGKGSTTTCVLWRQPAEEAEDILAYGAEALETWTQYEMEDRAGVRFAFGFKPDLVKSAQARRDAWAFLLKANEEIEGAGLPRRIEAGGMAVVIGVPAEIGEDHKQLTAEIARKAGLGEVECVEEPLGALAHHLNNGDITPAEARSGVVVVDFGGGTLDVALVGSDGLRQPWGAPLLGGRLLDDLFFQWLADQNQPLEIEEQEAFVVWQKECRELKENFSNRWRSQGDSMSDFKGHVFVGDSRKWLRNASVEEFIQRARNFRPSPIARRYFQQLENVSGELVSETPLDLLQWIENTLTRGQGAEQQSQPKQKCEQDRFSKVILTGGSSHWPFMRELAARAFGVDAERDVILSHSPETTIGSGLALYNVLKLKNEARCIELKRQKFQAAVPFQRALSKRLDRFAADAAESLLQALMPRIEKVMWDWYNHGGSLNDVEKKIGKILREFEKTKEAEKILKPHSEVLDADLVRLLRDHLRQFLADNEIGKEATCYVPEKVTSLKDLKSGSGAVGDGIAEEFGEIAQAMTLLAAGIAATVLLAAKINLIVLAALAHPLLAVALGLGALLAAIGVGEAAKDIAEEKIKNHHFNRFTLSILKLRLTNSKFKKKLEDGRVKAKTDLQTTIRESTRNISEGAAEKRGQTATPKKPLEQLVLEKFQAVIDLVIQDLGVLEQIRQRGDFTGAAFSRPARGEKKRYNGKPKKRCEEAKSPSHRNLSPS